MKLKHSLLFLSKIILTLIDHAKLHVTLLVPNNIQSNYFSYSVRFARFLFIALFAVIRLLYNCFVRSKVTT